MAAITTMPEDGLLRLMTWLSPAFPVGSYVYSHGLEAAIDRGWVKDRDDLAAWLADVLEHGAPRNDGLFIKALYAGGDIAELAELATAFQPTMELRAESLNQGKAFMRALRAIWPDPAFDGHPPLPYPLALGLAAKRFEVPLDDLLRAFMHAFLANLVSAAVRLVPLGQTDGLVVLAGLAGPIADAAARASEGSLDDLGGCAIGVDIASMFHETQHTRLFRS